MTSWQLRERSICSTSTSADSVSSFSSTSLDAAMSFGRRAEDTESAEVEVEQIGRRVDAAQGAIQLEVVAREALFEAARKHNLEDVAPQAVGNAPTDVGLVLLVGERRGDGTRGMEVVGGVVAVVDGPLHHVELAFLAFALHFEEHHFVAEVVEYNQVLVEDVQHVGGVVGGFAAVLYRDVLEVADSVERGVSVQATVVAVLSLYPEAAQKIVDGIFHPVGVGHGPFFAPAVGQAEYGCAVVDADACQRAEGDEGAVVFASVIVGTLHEGALRKDVAHLQVSAYRRVQVAEQGAADGLVSKCSWGHSAVVFEVLNEDVLYFR